MIELPQLRVQPSWPILVYPTLSPKKRKQEKPGLDSPMLTNVGKMPLLPFAFVPREKKSFVCKYRYRYTSRGEECGYASLACLSLRII